MTDLLRSASFLAEKMLRRHGRFTSVLWICEDATGKRRMLETTCSSKAPAELSDSDLMAGLAEEMRADSTSENIIKFAVCYAASCVTETRATGMAPVTTKTSGVVIEEHSDTAHLRIFRAVQRGPRGAPMLAAAGEIETADDSPYAAVLTPAPAKECVG